MLLYMIVSEIKLPCHISKDKSFRIVPSHYKSVHQTHMIRNTLLYFKIKILTSELQVLYGTVRSLCLQVVKKWG
jgi:hypothetical protein